MHRPARPNDLLHKRLQRFTRLLQGVEEGDARAVHRTRVATRRLREVLPILGLEPEITDKLSRRLRKITRVLGKVRELDVLLETVDELKRTTRYPPAAVARLADRVAQERSRARSRHLVKGQLREMRRAGNKLEKLVRTLEAAPDGGEPKSRRAAPPSRAHSIRWAVEARIGRRASDLADAIARAGAVYLPERLHRVRIATKKLRYALELEADLSNVKSSPDLRLLRRTQDLLGRLHDLQVLIDRTREAQASLTPPDLNVWRGLDVLVGSLEDECRRLHGRYVHDTLSLMESCRRLSGHGEGARSQKSKVRSQSLS